MLPPTTVFDRVQLTGQSKQMGLPVTEKVPSSRDHMKLYVILRCIEVSLTGLRRWSVEELGLESCKEKVLRLVGSVNDNEY